MKKFKIFLFLLLAALILNNCASVQSAMDPKRKNNTDEFMVEKKSPLSMPPDFEKLPIPKNEKIVENKNKVEENNFKKLISESKIEEPEISNDDGGESLGSFEKSLIEKIKNN